MTASQFHSSQIVYITESERINRKTSAWTMVIALLLFGYNVFPSHPYQKLSLMAIASLSNYLSIRLSEHQKTLSRYSAITHQQSELSFSGYLDYAMAPQPKQPALKMAEAQLLEPEKPSYYDWDNIEDEAVGFLICGNSGSAKSSLATWLAGHLSRREPIGVLALDPHYNDCWKLAGITSVGKIEMIEAALKWLLKELDDRCDRKGNGEPLGDPLLIICDELNAALERFKDKKVVESALKRLGSEGRKFGLTFCGLNQSSNVNAIGIDSKYRSNYALILLGQSARSHPQMGKHLADVAYPCLLDGSIAPAIAIHPTHGSYSVFKKKGNAPKNLMQINQLPLPQRLMDIISNSLAVQALDRGLSPNVTSALVPRDKDTVLAPEFDLIIKYLERESQKDGSKWIRDNYIIQSISAFKKNNIPVLQMQGYLQFLETQGLIETRPVGRNKEGLEARKL